MTDDEKCMSDAACYLALGEGHRSAEDGRRKTWKLKSDPWLITCEMRFSAAKETRCEIAVCYRRDLVFKASGQPSSLAVEHFQRGLWEGELLARC
jgi:hypothetical protein